MLTSQDEQGDHRRSKHEDDESISESKPCIHSDRIKQFRPWEYG